MFLKSTQFQANNSLSRSFHSPVRGPSEPGNLPTSLHPALLSHISLEPVWTYVVVFARLLGELRLPFHYILTPNSSRTASSPLTSPTLNDPLHVLRETGVPFPAALFPWSPLQQALPCPRERSLGLAPHYHFQTCPPKSPAWTLASSVSHLTLFLPIHWLFSPPTSLFHVPCFWTVLAPGSQHPSVYYNYVCVPARASADVRVVSPGILFCFVPGYTLNAYTMLNV